MSIFTFSPVVRLGSHVIITAFGESGTGKTLSLLKLGRGLVGPKGRLAMMDTENGRGRIYADAVTNGYEYAELTPPFTPERYIEGIDIAEKSGVEALIIDTGSGEWEGFGGILEIADEGRSQSGAPLSGLVKWAKPKARHKKYVQRLLDSPMHLLISLRAKEKLIQLTKPPFPPGTKSGDIISDGYVAIQDKRFIFETTVQLFFPTKGQRGVPFTEEGPMFKCPGDLLGAFPAGQQIDEATGERIAEWVKGGKPVDHQAVALKKAAEEAAALGTPALREHWRTLSKESRTKLAATEDNLRSIAATTDREIAERETVRQAGHTNFGSASADEPSAQEPIAETISKALAAAASTGDVDLIFNEHAVALKDIPHDEWLPIQAAIDKRREELEKGIAA